MKLVEATRIFSCGSVIVRFHRGEFFYLLLKAYNFWDFPKGQKEQGEQALETALREIEEETGLSRIRFTWGRDYYETPPYFNGRKVARYYLSETRARSIILPINPELGHPEHTDWRWFSRVEALQAVTPRVREVIYWSDEYLAYDRRLRR